HTQNSIETFAVSQRTGELTLVSAVRTRGSSTAAILVTMADTAPVQWVSNNAAVGLGGGQSAMATFTIDHAHGLLNLVNSWITGYPVPLVVRINGQSAPIAETAADGSGFGYVVTGGFPYNVPIPIRSGFALSA